MDMEARLERLKMLEQKYPELTKALKMARNVNTITYPLSEDKDIEQSFSIIESLLSDDATNAIDMFKDLLCKEVDKRLESMRTIEKMPALEALGRATDVVTLIVKIIDIGVDNSADLYEKAKMAYLIASEKVPKEEKDKVAFPSNYWSMRAKQVRSSYNIIPTLFKNKERFRVLWINDSPEDIKESFKHLIDLLERGRTEAETGGANEQVNKLDKIIKDINVSYSEFLKLEKDNDKKR